MINSQKPKKTSIELDNAIQDDLRRKVLFFLNFTYNTITYNTLNFI